MTIDTSISTPSFAEGSRSRGLLAIWQIQRSWEKRSEILHWFNGIRPLLGVLHDGSGEAVIGGYVYRGPVAELQGKYFYADFVTIGNTRQLWALDFKRGTNPAGFNGINGTNTDVSALWQSLVFDPTDPSYQPDSRATSSAGLDHIVSFGEDNAGNLYLVDFGNGTGFKGQYPGARLGEIFRLSPIAPSHPGPE